MGFFIDPESAVSYSASGAAEAYTQCERGHLCVFVQIPEALGSESMNVTYKYKSYVSVDNSDGDYDGLVASPLSHEHTGHSGQSGLVSVSEIGSSRFWSTETDGTPSIAFEPETDLHVCSKRGLCDYETGLCNCFDGYSGYRCSQRSILGY